MRSEHRRRAAIVLLVSVSAAVLGSTRAPAAQFARRPLLLLADQHYAPLSYMDNGRAAGVDVELAQSLSKALGREVRIELVDWADAQERVLRQDADGLLSMSMTDERRRLYDFSTPIISHDFAFFVRSGETVPALTDFAGKTVGVTAAGLPRHILQRSTQATLITVDHYDDGFARLARGEIDAVAADLWVGAYTVERSGVRDIVPAGRPFATLQGGIAVAKGNTELVADLDRAIAQLETDGTINRIRRNWRRKEMLFFSRERVTRTLSLAAAGFLTMLVAGAFALRTQRRTQARHKRSEATRRELEAQLQQSQKMEAIGRLAGGVAHDFNNILTAVIGFAELVNQQLDEDHPAKQDVEEIRRAAGSAASLTRQLLIFSRKELARPRVLDLNEIAAGLDKMLRRLVGEDIEFVVQPAPELAHVLADASQIEQVIVNLVVNARDAMPAGGRLVVTTGNARFEDRDLVAIAVQDTGTGMTAEVRAQIFQPFFTTKGPDAGTGLGLPTVQRIVQQAGGYIDVASTPAEGTTFTVYLPAVADAIETTSIPESVGDAVRVSGTILFVEDDESIRALGERVLRACGFTVLTARQTADVLDVAERYPGDIDLVVTDIVISGRELAERWRRECPRLQVMCMPKPYTPALLVREVRRVLKNT
jgi:signal transduction histidine kinase